MKKLIAILAILVLLPVLAIAIEEPVECGEGEILVSVMTDPGSPAVQEVKHWTPHWDIFHLFGHWVIDVPYQASVPATYEDQCVVDEDYVPPVEPPIDEVPPVVEEGGGSCILCVRPHLGQTQVIATPDGHIISFLSPAMGTGGIYLGKTSVPFPINDRGQAFDPQPDLTQYDQKLSESSNGLATYHSVFIPYTIEFAGDWFVRPYYTPDQGDFPFYGTIYGPEFEVFIH